jgi:uncharacterized SAM-binding protein YcdF (DUF218 family)
VALFPGAALGDVDPLAAVVVIISSPNQRCRERKKILILTILILGLLVVAEIIQFDVGIKGFYFNLRNDTVNSLQRELVYEKFISTSGKTFANRTIIYVLGGGQDSLNTRFQIASILYHQGISNKILILARAGTTEFDFDLGKNLTNDEWSIRELGRFNVRKEDIEVVPIQGGFFGTVNEAKNLPEIVQRKGFNRLILVTSSYHTKRTIISFSRFATDRHIKLFIYGSEDNAGLGVLLEEYIKLFLYEKIVLPGYQSLHDFAFQHTTMRV